MYNNLRNSFSEIAHICASMFSSTSEVHSMIVVDVDDDDDDDDDDDSRRVGIIVRLFKTVSYF